MGRKQARKRKHLLFYFTCIIIILEISNLSGCTYKTKCMLIETQDLMASGEYSQALEKNQQILKEYPSMGDESLFQTALIFTHPDNPDKDYKKSLVYFRRLIEEYPDSRLKNQVGIYISLLNKIKGQDIKNEEQKTEILDLQGKIIFYKKEKEVQSKKIEAQNKKIDELQKNNEATDKKAEELQQQIEKLKEIDLNKQKKKRRANFK